MLETNEGSYRIGGSINTEGIINKGDVSDAFRYGTDKITIKKTGAEIKVMAQAKKAVYEAYMSQCITKRDYYCKELMDAKIGCIMNGKDISCDWETQKQWEQPNKDMFNKCQNLGYQVRGATRDIQTLDAIISGLDDKVKYPLTMNQMIALKSKPEGMENVYGDEKEVATESGY